MSEIPNANDLLTKNKDNNSDIPFWKYVRESALKNFQENSGYLGQGDGLIDCIEIYRLKNSNMNVASEHKKLFVSMFGSKGYDIKTQFTSENYMLECLQPNEILNICFLFAQNINKIICL